MDPPTEEIWKNVVKFWVFWGIFGYFYPMEIQAAAALKGNFLQKTFFLIYGEKSKHLCSRCSIKNVIMDLLLLDQLFNILLKSDKKYCYCYK